MEKTNAAKRSDLAKEMRDKYDERNEQLSNIENLPLRELSKEFTRKDIMDNFNQEMEEMKTRPGYEEARQTHLAEIQAKIKLAKSKKEKEKLQKEYEEKLAAADEKIKNSSKICKNAVKSHGSNIESVRGKKKAIIKDLRDNYTTVIDDVRTDSYLGKKIHIDLPAIGDFKGYSFDCCTAGILAKVPYETTEPEFLYESLVKLLEAVKSYMKNLGVSIDENKDYKKDLDHKRYMSFKSGNWLVQLGRKYKSEAGDCLKEIAGFDIVRGFLEEIANNYKIYDL